MNTKNMFLTAALGLGVAVSAHAATISWNVDNNGTVGGDGAGSLPPIGATAGVGGYLAGGWTNDFPDYNFTNLRNDSGVATTLDIAPASNAGTFAINFAHPGPDSDGSWNKEMLNGYLNAGNGATSSVRLSEIPYSNYDLVVYFSSDVTGRTGTVDVGGTAYAFSTMGVGSVANPDALFLAATSTTTSRDAANYAVFSGLNGANRTITVDIPEFGGIAGFQIKERTDTPPGVPDGGSTLLLLGAALPGLGFLRRKLKA